MRLEQFFEKFELLADAPNVVAQMRELVLQLAVTGKLVEQRKIEGSASDLMQEIRAERAALVAARKIKARKSVPVEIDEQPFDIPAAWRWARLSEVGYELGQKVPDRRFTYIDVGCIDSDKGRISERVEAMEPNEAPSRARKLVSRGTVIYSTVRPYLLNIAIVERDFEYEPIASTAFGILHPLSGINNRFLFYWLRSMPFTAYVQAGMKGMAYPAINDEKFYSGYIPLPPTAEQKRIVAKLDELMALCDRLEAQQQERDTRHAVLARASLSRFTEAPTPANLDFLFHKYYPITPSDLRKTILTLAVQGKLVPQDPDDEPAAAMLDRIVSTAKQRICGNGELASFDAPFEIPESWEWVRLPRVLKKLTDGTHHSPPNGPSGDFMYISAKNIKADGVRLDEVTYVTRQVHEEIYARCDPSYGDVLYIKDGATTGIATINQIKEPFSMLSSVALLKPTEAIFNRYLLWTMRSPFFYEETRGAMKGAAITRVTLSVMAASLLPLPPLAEQHRIVAKVDQLMSLVDKLETQLAASSATAEKLMQAVVAELTTPN